MIHTISPITNKFYDNHKGTEAYKFFESGFVLSLGSKKKDDLTIVKGKVSFNKKSLTKIKGNVSKG